MQVKLFKINLSWLFNLAKRLYPIILLVIPNNSLAIGLIFNCSISSAPPLDFGIINPLDSIPETATTVVNVTCTNLLSLGTQTISYTLSASAGGSNNQMSRVLKVISNTISYNMYTNNGYTNILGDNTNGTTRFSMSYALGALQSRTDNFTIYGKIPVQSISAIGIYTDSITLTLTY